MRRLLAGGIAVLLAGSGIGCGRLQTGKGAETPPPRPRRERAVAAKPVEPAKAPLPTGSPAAGTAPSTPTPPSPEGAAAVKAPVGPSALPSAPAPATAAPSPRPPEGKAPPAETPPPAQPLSLADEARSLRAALESLRAQFDRLPPDEVRTRLLLVAQGLSEIEARSPALVLWRTALRLEALHRAATPDVATAKAWLTRARRWVTEEGVGLSALESAEKALTANRWADAIAALRDAANRLNAPEQLDAITQLRASLLNALDALERHKPAVTKAEVNESLKGLDRLLAALP